MDSLFVYKECNKFASEENKSKGRKIRNEKGRKITKERTKQKLIKL